MQPTRISYQSSQYSTQTHFAVKASKILTLTPKTSKYENSAPQTTLLGTPPQYSVLDVLPIRLVSSLRKACHNVLIVTLVSVSGMVHSSQ